MASIAKDALAVRVLEHLNVLAAGATPADADQTLVEEYIDAAWSRLRALGYAPFLLDEIPEWAQLQMCAIVAHDVAPKFGVTGQREIELRSAADRAEFDLNRQVSGKKHKRRVRQEYF
jgi:hypothetical protein